MEGIRMILSKNVNSFIERWIHYIDNKNYPALFSTAYNILTIPEINELYDILAEVDPGIESIKEKLLAHLIRASLIEYSADSMRDNIALDDYVATYLHHALNFTDFEITAYMKLNPAFSHHCVYVHPYESNYTGYRVFKDRSKIEL